MKKLIIILTAITLIFGCNGAKKASKPKFPPQLAGTWKTTVEDSPWEIAISKDGKVISAVLPMGTKVKPNITTKVEMIDGSFSYYTAGDFTADYNPINRELFVSIEMKDIRINVGDLHLKQTTFDRFIGPISEDFKQWDAEWIYLFDYGPGLPQSMDDITERHLFKKIAD